MKPRHAAMLAWLSRIRLKDVVRAAMFSMVGVLVGSIAGGVLLVLSFKVSPEKWPHGLRGLLIPIPALASGYLAFFWSLTHASRAKEIR